MCLGIPMKIVKIDGKMAEAEMNEIRNNIRIDLIPSVKLGDYVMVHAGFGIEIIDKKTADDTLDCFNEINELMGEK